jgi:hypothetical protein
MRIKTFFERNDDLTIALANVELTINNYVRARNLTIINCHHQVTVDANQVDFLVSIILTYNE